ncbi:hypothetical protein ACFQ51_18435 [Streptomyces kaempferi]
MPTGWSYSVTDRELYVVPRCAVTLTVAPEWYDFASVVTLRLGVARDTCTFADAVTGR